MIPTIKNTKTFRSSTKLNLLNFASYTLSECFEGTDEFGRDTTCTRFRATGRATNGRRARVRKRRHGRLRRPLGSSSRLLFKLAAVLFFFFFTIF